MTACTCSTGDDSAGNSTTAQVAPARAVGCRILAGGKGGDDVERFARLVAFLLAQGGEVPNDFGELVGMLEVDREEVLVARCSAQRSWLVVEARDPYRHAGLLDRRRRNRMASTV